MNRFGPRVLVVEDEESLAFVVAKFFHALGWQDAVAHNPADAIDSLSPPPDLVVLDLMMPGPGDGIAVLREIRRLGLVTTVVVHTGCERAESLEEVRSMQPDRVYRKPIDWDDFQVYVGNLFVKHWENKRNHGS